jgi:hypothetical protein
MNEENILNQSSSLNKVHIEQMKGAEIYEKIQK